jgi:hypothetical protein
MQLFRYPSWLVRERIDLADCPHSGYFDCTSRTCRACGMETECRWLSSYDDYASPASKPAAELLEALDLAIDYVDCCRAGHKRACRCDSCVWWREARSVRAQMT